MSSPTETRILNHMNADHSRELTLYLLHHASVPRSQIGASPALISLTTESMTISTSSTPSSSSTAHTIPFVPPLSSLGEARPRLVAMATEALTALGLSPIDMSTSFAWPRGLDLIPFLGVGTYFFSAAFLPLLVSPGSTSHALLQAYFPLGGAATFEWLVKAIFWPVLLIHVVESWWFDRSRCQPHGVQRGSLTWFLWEWCCFMEGFTAFKRFDGLVEVQRRRKEKQEKGI